MHKYKIRYFFVFFYCSYLGTTLRQANIEPMPSISDVRRVITEFAILPLGKYRIGRQLRFSLEKIITLQGCHRSERKMSSRSGKIEAEVVRRLDNAIHWISPDKC